MSDTIPAPCLRTPRVIIAAALLVVACALGGCAAGGAASGSFAMAPGGSGATVAFESIDGPPQAVFDRMVSVLVHRYSSVSR